MIEIKNSMLLITVFTIIALSLCGCLKEPPESERLIIYTRNTSYNNSILSVELEGKVIGKITKVSNSDPDCNSNGPESILVSLQIGDYNYEIFRNGNRISKGILTIEPYETCLSLKIN